MVYSKELEDNRVMIYATVQSRMGFPHKEQIPYSKRERVKGKEGTQVCYKSL